MSIQYSLVKITSPLSRENTGKYYAKAKSKKEMDLRSLAKRISSMSTLSVPDIYAVLESLIQVIPEALLDGYIIKLGDFGSFSVVLKSEGVDNIKDFKNKHIKKNIMNFRPGSYIKKSLKNAKYEKI